MSPSIARRAGLSHAAGGGATAAAPSCPLLARGQHARGGQAAACWGRGAPRVTSANRDRRAADLDACFAGNGCGSDADTVPAIPVAFGRERPPTYHSVTTILDHNTDAARYHPPPRPADARCPPHPRSPPTATSTTQSSRPISRSLSCSTTNGSRSRLFGRTLAAPQRPSRANDPTRPCSHDNTTSAARRAADVLPGGSRRHTPPALRNPGREARLERRFHFGAHRGPHATTQTTVVVTLRLLDASLGGLGQLDSAWRRTPRR